jgi:glycosyltransferase involved in cell wall biosynthesis
VRNGARHLPECIRSLRAQSLEDVEFVVVDDGSTDGTPDLLAAWAADDSRVRLFRGPSGREGVAASLERARAEARAPVLARMDHDDIALPDRLAAQLNLLENRPRVVLCGCGVESFREGGLGDGSLRYQAWLNALTEPSQIVRDLFVECPLAHPTFMMRADAVAHVGGYRDRGWPEDYDLVLRLWEAGGAFAKVPEILLLWRDHPRRLSRTSKRYAPAAFRRLKVDVLRRTLLKERDGVVVWGAGPTGKAFSHCLAEAAVPVRAFVDLDPRKVGQEIHGVPVVRPDGVAAYRGSLCVAAVSQDGAREEIRGDLSARGWREMTDFCAVA